MYQLNLKTNQLEVLPYPDPHIGVRGFRGRLYDYPDRVVPPHWHNDLEFILLEEGEASYRISGKDYHLVAGDGLFVNSNRLHNGGSVDGKDFLYSVLQVQIPVLMENRYVAENYLAPLMAQGSLDGIHLAHGVDWQRQLLELVYRLIEINLSHPRHHILETLSGLYQSLHILYQHMVIQELTNSSHIRHAGALVDMVAYIQQHYTERLTLRDIAEAGAMCQSRCCSIFRSILQQAPIAYLQNYRIQRACILLSDTRMSVTEIAGLCGFNGASYFIETFRQRTGITPGEYRRRSACEPGQGAGSSQAVCMVAAWPPGRGDASH